MLTWEMSESPGQHLISLNFIVRTNQKTAQNGKNGVSQAEKTPTFRASKSFLGDKL